MAPTRRAPAAWSDSDSDSDSDAHVETSVLLGVPDGAVDVDADRADAAVSRIGGHPALLPAHEPPFASSHCKACARPMELLVQMWCPFEDSPMDRALYVWGCARAGCQRKDGSIRAFRSLRTNDAYAHKLAQKRARQAQRDAASAARKLAAEQDKQKREKLFRAGGGNPFSMGGASTTNAFGAGFGSGIGAQIFGGASTNTPPGSTPKQNEKQDNDEGDENEDADHDDDDDEDSEDEEDEDEELLTALAATSIHDSAWHSAPAYPPLYLSTVAEYVPPAPKAKVPRDAVPDDHDGDDGGKGKQGAEGWAKEAYENSMDVDAVFERFMRRVGCEGAQCVRYELGGTPLPFASDATFDLLWPAPGVAPQPGDLVPITKGTPPTAGQQQRRTYAGPARVAPCPGCGARRVFECQLMPNLINVLRASESESESADTDAGGKRDGEGRKREMTDEERRAAVQRALAGQDEEARGMGLGMEWGTCMVFSCERDCCVDDAGREAREAWREEVVLVQWDT